MVLLASAEDEKALISNPFLDLPILTAARGFLAERETVQKSTSHSNTALLLLRLQWGESSLEQCKAVLEKMSVYWGGVGCVKMILDQQSSGRLDFELGEGAHPDSRIDRMLPRSSHSIVAPYIERYPYRYRAARCRTHQAVGNYCMETATAQWVQFTS